MLARRSERVWGGKLAVSECAVGRQGNCKLGKGCAGRGCLVDRLFVAVLGHPYGPNAERGVFRSTDGGQSWQKVLFKDENTGAVALEFDPTNSQIVYAVLFESRHGPWENGSWQGKNRRDGEASLQHHRGAKTAARWSRHASCYLCSSCAADASIC